MPIYSFRRQDNNELIEIRMTFKERDRRVKNGTIRLDDGTFADQDLAADHCEFKRPVKQTYPRTSEAAGVSETQVAEAQMDARKHGFTEGEVRFNPSGSVTFGSRKAERKYLRAIGMIGRKEFC